MDKAYREHRIKILPEYYEACLNGSKRFELRKDDRNYQVGDYIWLCEWDGTEYTGRSITGMGSVNFTAWVAATTLISHVTKRMSKGAKNERIHQNRNCI